MGGELTMCTQVLNHGGFGKGRSMSTAIRDASDSLARPAPAATLELERLLVEGMAVRVGHGLPRSRPARGSVVLLTGRAEFIEKYEETVADLTDAGFAVATFDWRGQGGSDRYAGLARRGHVLRIEDYLLDLSTVLEHLERRHLPRPWLMLGHSMGGHVGLRYLAEGPQRFQAAVLSAPMFGINLRPLPEALAQAICRFMIGIGGGPLYAPGQRDFNPARLLYPTNKLTSCPERFEDFLRRVDAAPDLIVGGVTYHWLAASLRSIALTRRPGYVEAIQVPILVCQAGDERVVCNRSITTLARRLPHGRLLVFPDGRHELLREREPIRRRLIAAIIDFADEVAASG